MKKALAIVASLALVYGQQVGTNTAENHPQITTSVCTKSGGCQTQQNEIVLDANWRWVHNVGGYTNCYTGNKWNTEYCPDPATCAQNCAVDGADYQGTYGISTSGNELDLGFVTKGQYSNNIGSRNYLMANETYYQIFTPLGQEFTFDVDVSNLPCGLNGAVYFVSMDADGGMQYPSNKAGAKYGTGYCDAQCPQDLKFIRGQANTIDWTPDSNNGNAGTGFYGTCCTEMDLWEANSMSSAYTPHVCTVVGQYSCNGTECGNSAGTRYEGVCDKDGCDFNSYRMGAQNFYGKGMKVDTTRKFSIVTQFITSDGTANGDLVEIKRFYVQDGNVIPNSNVNVPGMDSVNSISDDFCKQQKKAFGDQDQFEYKGGLKAMGQALQRGVVLVLSLWDDYSAYMLWLDSNYPIEGNPSTPGIARGSCPTSSGRPWDVEAQSPNANVKYSNIRVGEIGSTY